MLKSNTGTHRKIPISFKLKAIHFCETNDNNISKTAKTFGVDRKCVRTWLRNKDKLIGQNNKTGRFRVEYSNKLGMFPQMEEKLKEQIRKRRINGENVDATIIQNLAKEIIKEIGSNSQFKASRGWLNGFLDREKLVLRRIPTTSKDFSRDICAHINKFHESCSSLINSTERQAIFSMSETCIYLDIPWKQSIDKKTGRNKLKEKEEYERKFVSVVFTASADGTKLKPIIIVPRNTPLNDFVHPDNVVVVYERSGKLNETILCEHLLENIFKSHIIDNNLKEAHLFMKKMTSLRTEKVKNVMRDSNIIPHYLPVGTSNLLLPANASWSRELKMIYYRKWTNWYVQEERTCYQSGMVATPTFKHAIKWISDMWEQLPSYIIYSSFDVCGITSKNQLSYHNALMKVLQHGAINEYVDDYDDVVDGDLVDSFKDANTEDEESSSNEG